MEPTEITEIMIPIIIMIRLKGEGLNSKDSSRWKFESDSDCIRMLLIPFAIIKNAFF